MKISKLKKPILYVARSIRYRIGPDETRRALQDVMGEGAELLFVHSSLSRLGHFVAGPLDILSALRSASGILGAPTHSYTYPKTLGAAASIFNAASTPSQNGLLTDLVMRQPDAVRSIHSTHSLALCGSHAVEITSGHYLCDTPCGAGTPYHRMVDRKASILLWGVNFHSYTLYHTAEDAAESAYAYEEHTRDRLRAVDENGNVRECISRRQTRNPRRFNECGKLMEKKGLVRRSPLGAGFLRTCRIARKSMIFWSSGCARCQTSYTAIAQYRWPKPSGKKLPRINEKF